MKNNIKEFKEMNLKSYLLYINYIHKSSTINRSLILNMRKNDLPKNL